MFRKFYSSMTMAANTGSGSADPSAARKAKAVEATKAEKPSIEQQHKEAIEAAGQGANPDPVTNRPTQEEIDAKHAEEEAAAAAERANAAREKQAEDAKEAARHAALSDEDKAKEAEADAAQNFEGDTQLDSNGVEARNPGVAVDSSANPKDGPVTTSSDPARKTTEVAPADVFDRAHGGAPVSELPPLIGDNPNARATFSEHGEEATKQAERLQGVQDNIRRGGNVLKPEEYDAVLASHDKVSALLASYPGDTADEFILWGYGGVKVTFGDLKDIMGMRQPS